MTDWTSGYVADIGYTYGYSTAAAAKEAEYLAELRKDADKARPKGAEAKGYNAAAFDFWSTAGSNPTNELKGDKEKTLEQAKWIKNW